MPPVGPDHMEPSSRPLSAKLGIRDGSRTVLLDPPGDLPRRLEPLPVGARILPRVADDLDVVVIFGTELRRLAAGLERTKLHLAPDGRLWVAWPTKASKVPTDVTFERAQRLGLDAGLVDNKSASITEVFQGLQFVYRLKDRPRRR